MANVLIAGESGRRRRFNTKGLRLFTTVAYQEGVHDFKSALESTGHSVSFMPNHEAAQSFPRTVEELEQFDVVVLSDIGSNTLLLPQRRLPQRKASPNRLRSLRDWVKSGGSLMMVGGYLSFQGIEGKANYKNRYSPRHCQC